MTAAKINLLTGATGYIGGRLLALLSADGGRVRCLARQPENLRSRVPDEGELVRGDVRPRQFAGFHQGLYETVVAREQEDADNTARCCERAWPEDRLSLSVQARV